jgi:hypothetical protein
MSPNPPANAMLTALSGVRAFIIFRKSDKCPVDTDGRAMDAQQRANWMLSDQAQAWAAILGDGYGVGLVLHPELKIFCVDIDHALANGQWSELATTLCHLFAGCAIEVSMSGTGLHIFGRYVGDMPPHKSKNTALGIECYHEARYIALTGTGLIGDVNHDCTALLPQFVAQYFTQADDTSVKGEWTDGPLWHVPGTADDSALLEKMRRSKSMAAIFSGERVTNAQLLDADADALAKQWPGNNGAPYDASSADMSLANRLMWWTGGDCERTDRIMRESALKRDKWDHRADYLTNTICDALAFVAKSPPQGKTPAVAPTDAAAAQLEEQQALEAHKKAVATAEAPALQGVTLADFYSSPTLGIIFVPLRTVWPAESVDARIPWVGKTKPSKWLARNRSVEAAIWSPGDPMIIKDRLMDGDEWVDRPGCYSFNLYRAPTHPSGNPAHAEPWVQLLRYVYPGDADHFLKWFAHRRQFPGVKPNHGLVMGGAFGIGKDSILEPLVAAVGSSNFREATPASLIGRFNPFVKGVILRVSEAHDQGDLTRYQFYDRTKIYLAAPPKTLTCDEKNMREHQVMNVMGVVFTTNHKDGLYLPPNDRRHYVAWSELTQASFQPGYWRQYYAWLEGGGTAHIIALLDSIDLSAWDVKADPPKTEAFWTMVDAGRATEDAQIGDVLDALGNPKAVTLAQIIEKARTVDMEMVEGLKDPRNRKKISHRLDSAGYIPVRNSADKADGLWRIAGKRQAIYALKELSVQEREAAATALYKAGQVAGNAR